tara:strand:- start:2509 stop:2754 length:246 start_codon:yes stop_codon:yes gene_type:complete
MAELHIKKIDAIIEDQFGENNGSYGEKTRLIEDLGMDSLDLVELVMAIEDDFDTRIDDDVAEAWTTIGDLYKAVAGETADA